MWLLDTLRLWQNGHHFAGDIFEWVFVNKYLHDQNFDKFSPEGELDSVLSQWWLRLLTHLCITRCDLSLTKMFLSKVSVSWINKHTHTHTHIKRTAVLPQYLTKSQSRKIRVQIFPIGPIFERNLGSTAAEMPVKFQSDTIIITLNLAASRLREIWR